MTKITKGIDPTAWYISLALRGVKDQQSYAITASDGELIGETLNNIDFADFFPIPTYGRIVIVNSKEIQRIDLARDCGTRVPAAISLASGVVPSHADVRLFLRGAEYPLTYDGTQLDVEAVEQAFKPLYDSNSPDSELVFFDNDQGDRVYIRAAELVMAEVPSKGLVDAMLALDSNFWDRSHERLAFEGRLLSDDDRSALIPLLVRAGAAGLERYLFREKVRLAPCFPSDEVLGFAFVDALEALRRRGYSIVPGEAKSAWSLTGPRWGPHRVEMILAFDDAMHRADQQGYAAGPKLDGAMIEAALFTGLAALRKHDYKIVPGDRYIDFGGKRGWGGSTRPRQSSKD